MSNEKEHGHTLYTHGGCRCEVCTRAATNYTKDWRRKNRPNKIHKLDAENKELRELVRESYEHLWKQEMCSESGANWLRRAEKFIDKVKT